MTSQDGLVWRENTLGDPEPHWAYEPSIDAICEVLQKTLGKERVTAVDFFGQGAFNKLYTAQCGAEQLMMRVSLPVEPSAKTLSEVATLEYIRRNSTLPVPRVMDFEASGIALIGFEWMLMERMSGQPLANVWNETKSEMSWSAKEALVQRLVRFSAEMYNHQFQNIGNLFHTHTRKDSTGSDDTSDTYTFEIGKVVSMEFFWLNHATQDVPKGPFRCSRDWLAARLAFKDNHAQARVQAHNARESDASMDEEEDDADDEWEAAERTISIVKRIRQLLDDAFSPAVLEPEPTVLFHDDLLEQREYPRECKWGSHCCARLGVCICSTSMESLGCPCIP